MIGVMTAAAGCGTGRSAQVTTLRNQTRQAQAMSRRISVDFRHANVRDVLDYLARKGRLSVVIAPTVQGQTDLLLTDTSVRDILIVLLQSQRLAYDKTGEVYNIITESEYLQRYGGKPVEPLPGTSPHVNVMVSAKPVSIEAAGMDLVDLLRYVATRGDLDVVFDPDVAGQAAVRLDHVPAEQALDSIVRTNGLAYVRNGSIFHIMTAPAYEARYGQRFPAASSPAPATSSVTPSRG